MIKIATVLGSIRPGSYTGMALSIVNNELEKQPEINLINIDPSKLSLAFPGTSNTTSDSKDIQQKIADATGVILSTPEYHGSFSSVTKLIIENLGFPSVLAKKPIALLGVAAGNIGAIKSLEHLRSVCSHIGGIVIPGPVSIANVQSIFDKTGNCLDSSIEKRIRNLAHSLIDYIQGNICPKLALEQMARDAD